MKKIGRVAAVINSATEPPVKDVIWGKIVDPAKPEEVIFLVWKAGSQNWAPLGAPADAPPAAPAGVSFKTPPAAATFPTSTSIKEPASVVDNAGADVAVAEQTLPFTLAAAGKIRRDMVVVNYLAQPAVYEIVTGTEVANNLSAARAPLPANRLFVHDLDINDGQAAPVYSFVKSVNGVLPGPDGDVKVTAGAVKTVNGQAPDANGNITVSESKFKGTYATLAALQTAYPTATAGDFADVDPGAGTPLKRYAWDAQDGWVVTGGSTVVDATDALKGVVELATQAETDAGTDAARVITAKTLNDADAIKLGNKGEVPLEFSRSIENVQEFPVRGKCLTPSLEIWAPDGYTAATAAEFTYRWKADGGAYSASMNAAALATALQALTASSKTWIEITYSPGAVNEEAMAVFHFNRR